MDPSWSQEDPLQGPSPGGTHKEQTGRWVNLYQDIFLYQDILVTLDPKAGGTQAQYPRMGGWVISSPYSQILEARQNSMQVFPVLQYYLSNLYKNTHTPYTFFS